MDYNTNIGKHTMCSIYIKLLNIIFSTSEMYLAKLIDGISAIPEILPEFRLEARQLYEEIGHTNFQKKLIDLGEDEILDKQRLTRAYEVLRQTGKSIFWWQNQPLVKIFDRANFIHVNLNPSREKTYQNCNLRFVQMLKNGAVEEVQSLINQGVDDEMQITKTLGFLEIRDFLSGKKSQEKTIEIATQKTRNYAKRQLTWFRHQMPQKLVFVEQNDALNFLLNEIF
jgi:tRNA dimethylallyltransferase